MFGHYLSNKNEGTTVTPNSKFYELNKGLFGAITLIFYHYIGQTLDILNGFVLQWSEELESEKKIAASPRSGSWKKK